MNWKIWFEIIFDFLFLICQLFIYEITFLFSFKFFPDSEYRFPDQWRLSSMLIRSGKVKGLQPNPSSKVLRDSATSSRMSLHRLLSSTWGVQELGAQDPKNLFGKDQLMDIGRGRHWVSKAVSESVFSPKVKLLFFQFITCCVIIFCVFLKELVFLHILGYVQVVVWRRVFSTIFFMIWEKGTFMISGVICRLQEFTLLEIDWMMFCPLFESLCLFYFLNFYSCLYFWKWTIYKIWNFAFFIAWEAFLYF